MWGAVVFVCIVVSSLPVFSQTIINEVYYDHPGRDEGYEFIEIINVGDASLSLAGYALEFRDGRSDRWVAVWAATPDDSVGPGALFVVGGEHVVPAPDAPVRLGLQNGPDAVRLVAWGSELDRLGYGALVDGTLFEGRPAPDAPEGSSLGRYPDGHDDDDNASDFRVLAPSPGRFNRPRDDVALSLAGGTAAAAIVDEGAAAVIEVSVANRGVSVVPEGAVAVTLIDSTPGGASRLGTRSNGSTIHPGDSVVLDFTAELGHGYHAMNLVSQYADDNPANDTVAVRRRVGYPALFVSEVMSLPYDGCPEYVELFNAGALPYRLENHWLRDRTHAPVRATDRVFTIPPNGHFVITEDKAALLRCHASLDSGRVGQIAGSWPSLNHSGSGAEADSVVVLDHFSLTVDAVAYPPQPAATRGRSVERVDLYSSAARHVWLLSMTGGSPGRHHERVVLAPPRTASFSVTPNPFDPTAGETLVVSVATRPQTAWAHVQIFDITGRRLRDLGSTTALPMVFLWDGADSGGRTVSSGIYIVACEFGQSGAGNRSVERVVLGCGRKNP